LTDATIHYNGSTGSEAVHTHSYYGEITIAATCINDGVRTYICACGDSYTEAIAKDSKNHVGGTERKDAVAATSDKDGYTGDTYCTGCGAKIETGTVIPATGNDSGEGGNGSAGGTASGGNTSGGGSSGGGTSSGTASGGSSSGGGSASDEVTETVSEVNDSNPEAGDSSSVEKNTTTNPDGSVTVTTVEKNSDGSTKTVETTTAKDGSVEKVSRTVSADGSVGLTKTSTSGSSKTTEKFVSTGGGSGVTLSKLTTNAKSVSIPATVKVNGTSYKVTKIAANAFKNNKKITKIIIGKNITKIGEKCILWGK
jgi:hypothetical protein